jgi:DNA polymerase-3 subunit epsilon
MSLIQEIDRRNSAIWAQRMLARPLGEVLILDSETCDLNGEIIELAIIDTQGKPLYNRRFLPLTTIQPGAQRVHGITLEMLTDEPRFADEYAVIRSILGTAQAVLIYNAPFDIRCLNVTCELHTQPPVNFRAGCIMRYYAQWVGQRSRGQYKWQKLTGGDHSALGDARAALAVLKAMAESTAAQAVGFSDNLGYLDE